jgi:membrane protein required for beta-lactamase induction
VSAKHVEIGAPLVLLVPQVVVVLRIVVAALLGKGSRVSFFGWAVAATLLGLAFLSNISTPEQFVTMSEAERVGAARLDAILPLITTTLFALAIGAAVGGCVFRTPRTHR